MNYLLLVSLVLLAPWPTPNSGTGRWPIHPFSANQGKWPARQVEQGALQESVLTLADNRAPSSDLLQTGGSAPSSPRYGVSCYVFGMDGCVPCKMMEPHIKKLHEEGWAVFEWKWNEHQEVAKQYGVYELPTVVIVKEEEVGGKVYGVAGEQFTGYKSYEDLRAFLQRNQVYGPKEVPRYKPLLFRKRQST